MLTANEISIILEDHDVLDSVQELKNAFRNKEAPHLDISDHDFLSLIIMMPSISITLSTGDISLMEEMALNKKARTISKGGHYLKKDPVVYAMSFLVKSAAKWEDQFFETIRLAMEKSFDKSLIDGGDLDASRVSDREFKKMLMNAPYMFIRFLHSFFWDDTHEDLSDKRKISKIEFKKVQEIGDKLELSKTIIFRKFLDTFDVR
jgi:hypothetical protein